MNTVGPQPVRESKNLAGDLTAVFGGNLWRILVSLGASFLLARMLAPERLAPYALFQMSVDISLAFIATWTSSAIVRFGREEVLRDGSLRKTMASRLVVVGPLFLLGCIAYVLLREEISAFLGVSGWMSWLLPVAVGAMIVIETGQYLFNALSEFRKAALLSALQKSVFFLGVVLLFLTGLRESVDEVILALVVSGLAVGGWIGVTMGRQHLLPLAIDTAHVRKVLAFSLPILVNAVALTVIGWVDIMVIKRVLGDASVGTYHMAYVGFNVLAGVGFAVNTLFLPKMVSLRVQGKSDAIAQYVRVVVPAAGAIWAMMLSVAVVVIPVIVPLVLGTRYGPAALPLQILACAAIFQFLSMGLSSVIAAFDMTKQAAVVNIAAAVVNVVLDIVLVPRFGIAGAGWATWAAMSVTAAGCLLVASRVVPVFGRVWMFVFLVPVPTGLAAMTASVHEGAALLVLAAGATVLLMRLSGIRSEQVLALTTQIDLPRSIDRLVQATVRLFFRRTGSGGL